MTTAAPPETSALVVGAGKDLSWVRLADGRLVLALASRKGARTRETLVPGDRVELAPLDVRSSSDRVHHAIVARRPRRSEMRRIARGRERVVAANLDLVAIVHALADPPFDPRFVDLALASAIHDGLSAIAVFSKLDLAEPEAVAAVAGRYAAAGVPAFPIDGKHGHGVAPFAAACDSLTVALVGPSGAGKSTLLNRLGGDAKVGELSRLGRGRQTTTMPHLAAVGAGLLFDLPGVASYANGFDRRDLLASFAEFEPFAADCRFEDCAHLSEPRCAVHEAAGRAALDATRFASYRALATELGRRGALARASASA
ncbi:MAG: ribosome small subunit-dependent GTPase A [Vulcanimicrobiaceae bacterium]